MKNTRSEVESVLRTQPDKTNNLPVTFHDFPIIGMESDEEMEFPEEEGDFDAIQQISKKRARSRSRI